MQRELSAGGHFHRIVLFLRVLTFDIQGRAGYKDHMETNHKVEVNCSLSDSLLSSMSRLRAGSVTFAVSQLLRGRDWRTT